VTLWSYIFLLLALAIPFFISLRRANELFVISVRNGQPRFVRGRIPGPLLQDIADIVQRPRVPSGRIRVCREGGRARLLARGEFEPGQIQQLRNVLGTYTLSQIIAGRGARD
jgi:hypothetical protein